MILVAILILAHSTAWLDDWTEDWADEIPAGGMTVEHAEARRDMMTRHEWYWIPPAPTLRPPPTSAPGVAVRPEQWRSLVAAYFPAAEVDRALCIVWHESRGNPNATNSRSGAAGLFQVMPFWWDHYGGDRYDPETNVATARRVWDQQYWWGWSPYVRGLCR